MAPAPALARLPACPSDTKCCVSEILNNVWVSVCVSVCVRARARVCVCAWLRFLNNVNTHVSPSAHDRKRKGSKHLDEPPRASKNGVAGASGGGAGAGARPLDTKDRAIKTKTRLIAVYWLSQLGKAKSEDETAQVPGQAMQVDAGRDVARGSQGDRGGASSGGDAGMRDGEMELPPELAERQRSEIDQRAGDREGSLLEEEKRLLEKLMQRKQTLSEKERQVLEEVEMVQREKDAIKQREHENKKVRARVPRCPFTHFSNQFVCDW